MLSGSVTAVTLMVWLWIDSDGIRPLWFPFDSLEFLIQAHFLIFSLIQLFFYVFSLGSLLSSSAWSRLTASCNGPHKADHPSTRSIYYACMRGWSQHRSAWEMRYAEGSQRRPSDEAEEHVHKNVFCIHYRTILVHAHNTHCNNHTGPVWHNSSNMKDWKHQASQTYYELLVINHFRRSYSVIHLHDIVASNRWIHIIVHSPCLQYCHASCA